MKVSTAKEYAGKRDSGTPRELREEKAPPENEPKFLDILPGSCYIWYRIERTGSLWS
jgi:hypothetical protein